MTNAGLYVIGFLEAAELFIFLSANSAERERFRCCDVFITCETLNSFKIKLAAFGAVAHIKENS